jgi:hypothetical protein
MTACLAHNVKVIGSKQAPVWTAAKSAQQYAVPVELADFYVRLRRHDLRKIVNTSTVKAAKYTVSGAAVDE